jgi:ATPase subunit of ABC transporter with duplicated ATPase domains
MRHRLVGQTSGVSLPRGVSQGITGGDARRTRPGRVAYLSQCLEQFDSSLTVAENLAHSAAGMSAQQRSDLLAKLQFRGARMHLHVGALSGGAFERHWPACRTRTKRRIFSC